MTSLYGFNHNKPQRETQIKIWDVTKMTPASNSSTVCILAQAGTLYTTAKNIFAAGNAGAFFFSNIKHRFLHQV